MKLIQKFHLTNTLTSWLPFWGREKNNSAEASTSLSLTVSNKDKVSPWSFALGPWSGLQFRTMP